MTTAKPKIDLHGEIAELHTLLRVLGEEAIMMRNAGKLAQKEKTYFGNIVTEADSLVEREIVKRLMVRYPDHCIRGEELGASRPTEDGVCEYEWIINPIDGTTNFSKGLDLFAFSIALIDHGTLKMGLLYFPQSARFVYAIEGEGVFDNGKPLKKFQRPAVTAMRSALIAGATTSRKEGRDEVLSKLRMGAQNLVNLGSMSENCMLVAEGKLDAAIHTDATIFNIAATIPILEEAGCVVSGFEEDYPDLSRERITFIAASNRELLADIKKTLLPAWEKAEK